MKKSLILLLPLLFLAQITFAQKAKNVKIKWGETIKESKRMTMGEVIGHDETGIYIVKSTRRKVYVEHVDNDMNKTKIREIEMSKKKGTRTYELMQHFNNKLYLFTSFVPNFSDVKELHVETINKKTLQQNNDRRKLSQIEYSRGLFFNKEGEYYTSFSRDSSKIMVFYNQPYNRKKGNEKFGVHVYDEDMQLLWEKDITLPYQQKLFDVVRYKVDNQGDIYMLGRVYNEKKRATLRGEVNYKHVLLCYKNKGTEEQEYDIKVEDKYLSDMQIEITGKQNIICAGFYSERQKRGIQGSYFLSIDSKNGRIKTQNFKAFTADFVTQNMSERAKKKTEKRLKSDRGAGLYSYDLRDIILRSDGGAVLFGEQYYVRQHSRRDAQGNVQTYYTYHYNDIIVININPKGEIDWAKKIAKSQSDSNGGYILSYVHAVVGNKLYFIFNDNPKNLIYDGVGRPKQMTRRSNAVTLVTMDSKGNQERASLFEANEIGVYVRPKSCKRISKNELILLGAKRKTHRFGKITFK